MSPAKSFCGIIKKKGEYFMKKCKYCQTEIDSKAKICPHCKKKQG